jgi:hypothetical protein
MDATHIYCANCRAIRPVEFERLLPSEAALGTAARCARCSWLALTMIGEARVYCDVCDEIRPAVLHEYRPARMRGNCGPKATARNGVFACSWSCWQ